MINKVYIRQEGVESPSFESVDEQYEFAHKLAEIADNVSEDSYIEAKVFVPCCSPSDKEKVNARFGDVLSVDERFIQFEAAETRRLVASKYDKDADGLMTIPDVQSVKGNVSFGRTSITLFDEFRYFTGLTALDGNVNGSGTFAFNDCSSLRSITLPSSIVGIGSWAFGGCTSLERISNIEQVTRLSQYAFSNTPALRIEVSLPNLTSIAAAAFSRSGVTKILNLGNITSTPTGSNHNSGYSIGVFGSCPNLESIVLPSTLTSLGTFAANKCPNLRSVDFNHAACSIGNNAFQDDVSLAELKNVDGITGIGSDAFNGCTSLAIDVNMPNLSGNIGVRAFKGANIVKISNLGSITTLGSGGSSDSGVFQNCKSLKSSVLPSTITSFGVSAFQGCTALETVDFGNAVCNISNSAFSGCTSLREIKNIEHVASVQLRAFQSCSSLKQDIVLPNYNGQLNLYAFAGSGITGIDIQGNITSIDSYVFQNCSSLKYAHLPSSIKTLPQSIFEGCSALEDFDFSNVESIDTHAFRNCSSLNSVILPVCTSFGSYPFRDSGIKTFRLVPDCSVNASVILQGTGKLICAKFDGLTTIKRWFDGSGIKTLILPSVTDMNVQYAINNCKNLQNVIMGQPVPPPCRSDSFYNCNSTFIIYVPEGSVDDYKAAGGWSSYVSRIKGYVPVDSLPSDADTTKFYLIDDSLCYHNGTNWIAKNLFTEEENVIYGTLTAANWMKYADNEINIGSILSQPHDKIEYEFTTSGMSNAGHIYSANVADCGVWNGGYKLWFRFAESGSGVSPFQANTSGGRTIISVANSGSVSSWTVDVVSKGTHYEGTNDYALSPIDSDMCLFGQRKSSSDVNLGHGSFHSLKICNGNLVLHHFMPSMNESGMKGIVDLATGEFFYNENNQELLTIS